MMYPPDKDSVVPVSCLPYPFQPVFNFRYFNAVQSESFALAYLSDDNMVVSAPTGSGKTGIFELCILRLLSSALTEDGVYHHVPGRQKIVYIAPMKALVQEIFREWKKKFSPNLGLVCLELTGDNNLKVNDLNIHETDIILTTPEKFDSITRNHRDRGGVSFFGDIALILIDEVHLLNDSRGAALEAVVSRMKMLSRYPELKGCPLASIRFVAASATIPNIEDLAEWLGAPQRGIKRFGEEMRPVKLTSFVYGNYVHVNLHEGVKDCSFRGSLNTRHQGILQPKTTFSLKRGCKTFSTERLIVPLLTPDVVCEHSKGKPTLVFCCTRKGAQDAAVILADTVNKPRVCNPFIKSQEQHERLKLAAVGASDKIMSMCMLCGVAYHNGGLGVADRSLVEGLFLKGDLQVLCTTSTLAQVTRRSEDMWNMIAQLYFRLELMDSILNLEMCGRAGRPQFDDSGVVVLMTRNETVPLYENLFSGSEPVESQLLLSMAEHLNAEIVLMTVSDVSLAIDWLKCSYLYVRIKKRPQHYKIEKDMSDEQMNKHMKGICLQQVNKLANYGMVLMDEYGFTLKPLEPGRLMAKYYLNFETMKTITEIPERSAMDEILRALAKAEELSWIRLRRHEKRLLNAINQDNTDRIRFHVLGLNGKIKKRIQTDDEKIFVLVNDALSDEPSGLDFSMSQDVNDICTTGSRIARCMSDYFKFTKRYKETKNTLLLTKCLRQKLWEKSAHQLKQLHGIGVVTVKAFHAAGINSFEKLATADPRQLESITGRRFPYGDQVKECLGALSPPVDLMVRETGLQIGGKNEYTLELTRIAQPKSTTNKWHMADLIVGDECANQILFHERIRLDQFASPYPVGVYSTNAIIAALICEEFVGMDLLDKTVTYTKPNIARDSNHVTATHRDGKAQASQKEELGNTVPVSQPTLTVDSLRKRKAREGKVSSCPQSKLQLSRCCTDANPTVAVNESGIASFSETDVSRHPGSEFDQTNKSKIGLPDSTPRHGPNTPTVNNLDQHLMRSLTQGVVQRRAFIHDVANAPQMPLHGRNTSNFPSTNGYTSTVTNTPSINHRPMAQGRNSPDIILPELPSARGKVENPPRHVQRSLCDAMDIVRWPGQPRLESKSLFSFLFD